MTEAADRPEAAPRTAGGLLRAARQAQGLHIAALAASIKVAPRKLEWLESDQFDQLTDATFTRALAQTVCRSLKIDPVPVLALLPPPLGNRLDQVAEGLNAPFHERSGRLADRDWLRVANPAWWIALLLLVAAVAIYVVPAEWLMSRKPAASRSPVDAVVGAAPNGSTSGQADRSLSTAAADAALPSTAASSPPAAEPRVDAEPPVNGSVNVRAANATETAPTTRADSLPEPETASPPPPGILQVRANSTSWIDVTDARGQILISRLVQANESVALDGVMPFKLKIGNAAATTVVFRNEPVELEPFTRDNVARLVLK